MADATPAKRISQPAIEEAEKSSPVRLNQGSFMMFKVRFSGKSGDRSLESEGVNKVG